MKAIVLLLSAFTLMACTPSIENPTPTPFSDFLDYGTYDVGFKTLFVSDPSRASVPYADWSGRLYPMDESLQGRAIPLSVWYPAIPAKQALKFEHFVHLISRQSAQDVSPSNDSLARQIYIYQANELGGESFTAIQLDSLLSLQTNSYLNAAAVEGSFPLVIFPNGASPAYQSIMCEFLASHGYVVAGLPLKSQYSHVIDASVRGLETAVDDLQFGLQELLQLPNVDRNQIALLGNAMESSFCAGLASRNEKIKALISLEGGFLSKFEQDILGQTNFYEPQNLSIPILAIYAPHPNISPEYIADLKYSERYFAHFPEMSEFHFLNFGVFEEYVPGIIGEAKGDTKNGFKIASELILAFFDAKLKYEPQTLDSIYSTSTPNEYLQVTDTLYSLDGLPTVPNLTVLKNTFLTEGMSSIHNIYQTALAQGDNQPFPHSFYNDFRSWLAWKKDPDYIHRTRLYEMAVESFPTSARTNYYLAYYMEKTGQSVEAEKYYLRAMDLIDKDTNLDQSQKTKLRIAISNALQSF